MRNLAAARAVPDVDRVAQVEVLDDRQQVVGVVVHVVTLADLGRTAVATPIVGDDAIALVEEEEQLDVPVVCRERPAVAEDDRLARAPVLVEDLNAVVGGDVRHGDAPVGRIIPLAAAVVERIAARDRPMMSW